MAGPSWNYVLKFIITGLTMPLVKVAVALTSLHLSIIAQETPEWASPRSSSASPTSVSSPTPIQPYVLCPSYPLTPLTQPVPKLGVEFGSKLITIPEEDKVVKLQC